MLGQLVPAGGGLPIPLLAEKIILGRSPECDVVIPSRAVSGRHCKLTWKDGYWWVRDLDSRNGIGVNGVKCQHRRILPNETLCIPKMRFQLVYDAPEGQLSAEDNGHRGSDDSLALRALNDAGAGNTSSAATVLEEAADSSTHDDGRRPVKKIRRIVKPSSGGHSNDERATDHQPPDRQSSAGQPAAPRTSTPRRYLGMLIPAGGGDPIPLLQPVLLFGRSRQADIRLKIPTVSGRHCTLNYEDGYWFVEDLNSSNGVKVNGERVDRKVLIPGDELAVSSQRFTIDYEAEGEPPVDHSVMNKSLLEKAGLENIVQSDNAPAWITSHESDEPEKKRYRLDGTDPD
ncbi:MAG: FHA domain-containing protein [Fuerstiella sp.]